jgi:hypothetical protein
MRGTLNTFARAGTKAYHARPNVERLLVLGAISGVILRARVGVNVLLCRGRAHMQTTRPEPEATIRSGHGGQFGRCPPPFPSSPTLRFHKRLGCCPSTSQGAHNNARCGA